MKIFGKNRYFYFLRSQNRAGFTLIETLVVLGIIVILTTIMIAYNTNSRGVYNLDIEASKMVQVISLAKSLTLSTFAQNPTGQSGKVYYCGYGVYFNNPNNSNNDSNFCGQGNDYCIFQYIYNNPNGYSGSGSPCSNDPLYFSTNSSGNNSYYAIVQPNYEYQFNSDVSFAKSSNDINGLLFVPPAPSFFVISSNNIVSPSNDYYITLQSVTGQSVKLDISSQGQTSFQFVQSQSQ